MKRPSDRARLKRLHERGTQDADVIDAIFEEGLVCHVGFCVDGQPYVIPMVYAPWEGGLLLHGSVGSRLLRVLASGAFACVTVTLLDGIVVARSVFHSSLNYRSVVAFGMARLLEDPDEKARALEALGEHLIPGRTADARAPNAKESAVTSILRFEIEEATAKVRTGPPIDEPEDMDLPIWAGVVPLALTASAPEPAVELAEGIESPGYVSCYRRLGRREDGRATERRSPRWEESASEVLRHLALDETVKSYVLQNPVLYRPLYRSALRFIGGEKIEECVQIARSMNDQGHAVTIDFMGEGTREIEGVSEATTEFLRVVGSIKANALDASVSFDLSHLGLAVDVGLGFRNALSIVTAAAGAGIEVMINAEGVERTDAVLAVHGQLCQQYANVGITVQAFLHRAVDDLELVCSRPGRVRVVKGAFEAPEGLAFPRGEALDNAYLGLVTMLLDHGRRCSIATHDQVIVKRVLDMIEDRKMDPAMIEFEVLKGVAQERLDAVRDRGYATRIYLPYGREWYLYLCNRMAEHPPNIFQAIANAASMDAYMISKA
ncbi:MAG: proline dehydrogenase family protein [Gammaproteobacteria bacterium]